MMLLAAKTLLTPILLALCTIASHYWGNAVGGWLLGLPLASGPLSLFLAVQQGGNFAASAARSSLLGFLAVGVFCLVYLGLAKMRSWRWSLAGAIAACLGTVALLSLVHLPLAQTIPLVVMVLVGMNAMLGAAVREKVTSRPSVGAVVLRMMLAGSVVFALTAFAGTLGGTITGLLAPLPVLAGIMTVTAHRKQGAEAARGLLRGIVVGMWGGVAFFAVVAVFIGHAPQLATYAGATAAAAIAGGAASGISSLQPKLRLKKYLHHSGFSSSLHRFDTVFERVSFRD